LSRAATASGSAELRFATSTGDAWLTSDTAFGTIVNDDPNAYFPAVTVSPAMEVMENNPGVKVANHSLALRIDDGSGKAAKRGVTVSYRIMPIPVAELEFETRESFPVRGESLKIYIALNTSKRFSWSGSQYVEIPAIDREKPLEDLAVAGKDFVAQAGRLTIPAGRSQAVISFRTLADANREISRRFLIELTETVNGVFKRDKTVCEVTINDSTSMPTLQIDPPVSDSNTGLVEGTGSERTVYFTARLTRPVDSTVVASYSFLSGAFLGGGRSPDKTKSPATLGSDFFGRNGQVVFSPGQTTAWIPVRIIGDRREEKNEWFTLRINSNVKGASLGEGGSYVDKQVLIKDDDGPNQAVNAAVFAAAFAANDSSTPSGTSSSTKRPNPFR
jgi:hypothetical protein